MTWQSSEETCPTLPWSPCLAPQSCSASCYQCLSAARISVWVNRTAKLQAHLASVASLEPLESTVLPHQIIMVHISQALCHLSQLARLIPLSTLDKNWLQSPLCCMTPKLCSCYLCEELLFHQCAPEEPTISQLSSVHTSVRCLTSLSAQRFQVPHYKHQEGTALIKWHLTFSRLLTWSPHRFLHTREKVSGRASCPLKPSWKMSQLFGL